MEHIYRKNPGVFVANGPIACISKSDLARIKEDACVVPMRRSRICAHTSADDPVQEMIIAMCRDSYIAPHRHVGKTESFHVIEGQADIYFFDESGEITRIVSLSADSPEGFYYRLSAPLYHTVLPHGPMLVVHETITGPFNPDISVQAPFAPHAEDADAVHGYLEMLRGRYATHAAR
jgi:cupin fold WbuC family metalloprotein